MAQINKPTDYFNTVLYSGDSTSSHAITGVGFQPDWVWLKARNVAEQHHLFDVVRGAANNLNSDDTSAESSSIPLSSFDSDGFTLGSANSAINGSSYTYTSWNWLGGGTASSNTDGSITSQVSANTTSGFSIVRWSGSAANATIGHSLGSVPSMIICKDTSDTYNWGVYHQAIGNTKYLYLNSTAAEATSSSTWNNTTPTSTVFSVGNAGATNASGTNNMIAYCFAEKKGFSKFGSYSGNSSNDGTFVYTGFKPAMVIVKCTNAAENWVMWDNKRSPSNVVNDRLFPNLSNAESTSPDICDLVSNGFKFRYGPEGSWNSSGKDYIYMCFAETGLVGTNNIPATAR